MGDVYLAMTGGQSNLLFESNSSQFSQELKESKRKVVSPNEKSKTPLIQLTEAEEKENLDYLNKMKEETGVQPIWLKKE